MSFVIWLLTSFWRTTSDYVLIFRKKWVPTVSFNSIIIRLFHLTSYYVFRLRYYTRSHPQLSELYTVILLVFDVKRSVKLWWKTILLFIIRGCWSKHFRKCRSSTVDDYGCSFLRLHAKNVIWHYIVTCKITSYSFNRIKRFWDFKL